MSTSNGIERIKIIGNETERLEMLFKETLAQALWQHYEEGVSGGIAADTDDIHIIEYVKLIQEEGMTPEEAKDVIPIALTSLGNRKAEEVELGTAEQRMYMLLNKRDLLELYRSECDKAIRNLAVVPPAKWETDDIIKWRVEEVERLYNLIDGLDRVISKTNEYIRREESDYKKEHIDCVCGNSVAIEDIQDAKLKRELLMWSKAAAIKGFTVPLRGESRLPKEFDVAFDLDTIENWDSSKINTPKQWWDLYYHVESIGLKIKKRGKGTSKLERKFEKWKKIIHGTFEDETLMDSVFLATEGVLRFEQRIINQLEMRRKGTLLDLWHPLYDLHSHVVDKLLEPRIKNRIKAEKMKMSPKDMEQKVEHLKRESYLEKERDAVYERQDRIMEEWYGKGKKMDVSQIKDKTVKHLFLDLSEKLEGVKKRQDERLQREMVENPTQIRHVEELIIKMRESYGDGEKMKKEFEVVKKTQEERLKREQYGPDYEEEMRKIENRLKEVYEKQKERIMNDRWKKAMDERQDDELENMRKKDQEQDDIIIKLQIEISKLQKDIEYLKK